ncbi:MAG: hypothetical protein ACRDRL_04670 [Sciscionella sp.]
MIERRWQGDYRGTERFAQLRTACHGCRRTTHAHIPGEDGVPRLRTMLIVGDGTLLRDVAPGNLIGESCPICGDSEDPGWLAGFCPPV